MMSSAAPAFDAWLDQFFAAYYRQQPVSATFIGVHAYDDRLPDASEHGRADALAEAQTLLGRLQALPPEPLSEAQLLDRELAHGFLEIQQWELTSAHFGFGNPSLFTGEAVFGILSLLLRPFAPFGHRLAMATARLAAVPAYLEAAQSSLRPAPRAWIIRARRECAATQTLLGPGLERLLHDAGPGTEPVAARLRRAAETARDAFARFDTFLERELLPHATDSYACGGDAFALLLRRAHCLDLDAEALERYALEVLAAAPPPGETPRQIAGDCARQCAELSTAAWAFAAERDLLPAPDWPVRFVEPPAWVREAAPALYFLPYRAPAPFDAVPVTECFVPATADETTIVLNYVLHHASFGHHLQNWYAARAASRIGQVAAVDCASRIAMLCGGSLAEGWACYAVDLAREAGFLAPAHRPEQARTVRRMAARAVVDVRLHHGRCSLDEAAQFYQQHAGLSPSAARAEALKNSLFPGATCMYLVGWDGLWRLRREFQAAQGAAFSLRSFHQRVLSFGSVPVALIARAMRTSAQQTALVHQ